MLVTILKIINKDTLRGVNKGKKDEKNSIGNSSIRNIGSGRRYCSL